MSEPASKTRSQILETLAPAPPDTPPTPAVIHIHAAPGAAVTVVMSARN